MGLVIEMPYIRAPRFVPILNKTRLRMKDFIYIAMPLIVVRSVIFGLLNVTGLLQLVVGPLAPITVGILGLPAFASFAFVYGILRKEVAVEMLAIAAGNLAFNTVMSPYRSSYSVLSLQFMCHVLPRWGHGERTRKALGVS